jgi:hypothetical protein
MSRNSVPRCLGTSFPLARQQAIDDLYAPDARDVDPRVTPRDGTPSP